MPLSKLIPWVGFFVVMTPVLVLVVVDIIRRPNKTWHLDGDGGHNSSFDAGDGGGGGD